MPDTMLRHSLYTCEACGFLIELVGPRFKPHLLTCGDCGGPMESAEYDVELTDAGAQLVEVALAVRAGTTP